VTLAGTPHAGYYEDDANCLWSIKMRLMRTTVFRAISTLVLGLALFASPVQAEDEGPFHEPGISYKHEDDYGSKLYIDYACAAAIIVACLIVAAKNPHRSHLD